MNYKRLCHNRLCRVLICLVLICCLIAQMVPARANAIGLSGTVATGTAIAAGLVTLGIGVGATETTFNNLVDSLTAVSGSDRVPVWISETADGFVTYLQESFLGSLLAHCFDTGVLSFGITNADFLMAPDYSFYLDWGREYPYWGVARSYDDVRPDSRYFVYVFRSSSPFILSNNGQDIVPTSGGKFSYYSNEHSNSWKGWTLTSSSFIRAQTGSRTWTYTEFFSGDSLVGTSEDLTLGAVGATMSSSDYDPWRNDAIPVVPPVVGGGTADEEDVLPVAFPGLDTPSITGQTQTEAQTGTTAEEIVDVMIGAQFEEDATTPTEPDDIPGAGAVTATLLERLFGGVQEKLDATYISIREIPDLLRDFMLDVKKGFEELPSKFAEWFSNIQTSLELLVSGQLTIGQLLSEFISPLVDAFKALLQSLFSPSADFIANKVNSLIAKYPYLNTFLGLGADLKAYFLSLGTQPPIIYIDLGAATGSYYFGGRQAFIDLTWYSTYKPTMDAILGAFIWLWLAWRIFLTLPSIINGGSGAAGSFIRYSERSSKTPDGGADK